MQNNIFDQVKIDMSSRIRTVEIIALGHLLPKVSFYFVNIIRPGEADR